MKRIILVVLLCGILVCMCGCSANVNDLIAEGKYGEALILIEENPDKYADVYDEVRYRIAEISVENSKFEEAVSLLDGNQYRGASALLDKAKS